MQLFLKIRKIVSLIVTEIRLCKIHWQLFETKPSNLALLVRCWTIENMPHRSVVYRLLELSLCLIYYCRCRNGERKYCWKRMVGVVQTSLNVFACIGVLSSKYFVINPILCVMIILSVIVMAISVDLWYSISHKMANVVWTGLPYAISSTLVKLILKMCTNRCNGGISWSAFLFKTVEHPPQISKYEKFNI